MSANNKFDHLKTDMAHSVNMGRDEYPTTIQGKYELLMHTMTENKRRDRRYTGRGRGYTGRGSRNVQVSFAHGRLRVKLTRSSSRNNRRIKRDVNHTHTMLSMQSFWKLFRSMPKRRWERQQWKWSELGTNWSKWSERGSIWRERNKSRSEWRSSRSPMRTRYDEFVWPIMSFIRQLFDWLMHK